MLRSTPSLLNWISSWYIPIEDCAAKRTDRTRATEEGVPDCVAERRSLFVGREARCASRAAEGDRDDLALRLAELDVGREEAAVGHARAREDRVVDAAADLHRRAASVRCTVMGT